MAPNSHTGSVESSDIFRLGYISCSLIDSTPTVLWPVVRGLVAKASRKNHEDNITGALLYSGGYFCQILEGDPDTLEATFDRIQSDPRHTACRLVFFEPVDQRDFNGWSMALAGVEISPFNRVDTILPSVNSIDTNNAGQAMLAHLQVLTQSLKQTNSA
jgi:hypothetical protein